MFVMVEYYILLAVFFAVGFAYPAQKDEQVSLKNHPLTSFFDPELENSIDNRLVGGSIAADGSHPWMAAIVNGATVRSFICGASIITTRHFLTAAHCIEAITSGSIINTRIISGTNRWNTGGAIHRPQMLGRNPNYDPVNKKNDIGVIASTAVIVIHDRSRIIPISYDFVPGGIPVRVSGWGWQSAGGSLSDRLQELRLITFDGDSCGPEVAQVAASLGIHLPKVDPKVELCTLLMANFGICIGDGGSPLVRSSDNHLVGIASWGLPCARGAPDMFVRVSAFRDFIQFMLDFPIS